MDGPIRPRALAVIGDEFCLPPILFLHSRRFEFISYLCNNDDGNNDNDYNNADVVVCLHRCLALERKMSVRLHRDELIKKGILLPETATSPAGANTSPSGGLSSIAGTNLISLTSIDSFILYIYIHIYIHIHMHGLRCLVRLPPPPPGFPLVLSLSLSTFRPLGCFHLAKASITAAV